jgi:lipoyl(octanoyl) transferase
MEDLGVLPYAEVFAHQKKIHAQVVAGSTADHLLFVEHQPVITVSRRKTASQHIIAPDAELKALGIDIQPTDRGGDVTYHGPGQLVAYPIVRLQRLHANVGKYVRCLEDLIIEVLEAFAVQGHRVDGCTGVWVETNKQHLESSQSNFSKIAAIGVRVSRNVSLHGFALNVATNLEHFKTVVPCGLTNRAVTSLQQLLGSDTPTMSQVKEQVMRVAIEKLG